MNTSKETIRFILKIPNAVKGATPHEYSKNIIYFGPSRQNSNILEFQLLYDSANIVNLYPDYKLFIESIINAIFAMQKMKKAEIYGGMNKPVVKCEEEISYFDIPIPYLANKKEESIKISGEITRFLSGKDVTIKSLDTTHNFEISIDMEYFVYNTLCVTISYLQNRKLELFKKTNTEEIIYITPPARLLNFVFNSRKEYYKSLKITSENQKKIPPSSLKGKVSDLIIDDIEDNDFWTSYAYLRLDSDFEWLPIGFGRLTKYDWVESIEQEVFFHKELIMKNEELPKCIKFFESNGQFDTIAELLPAMYIDYVKKDVFVMYGNSEEIVPIIPEGWNITYRNFLEEIPEKDRFWVIDGKDYLNEVYGEILTLK